MAFGLGGVALALLVTRRVRPAGAARCRAPRRRRTGRHPKRRRVGSVVYLLVARRAELLHRQQRVGDGLLSTRSRITPNIRARPRTRAGSPKRRSAGRRPTPKHREYFFDLAWRWIRSTLGTPPAFSRARSATCSARPTSRCPTAIRSTPTTSARCCDSPDRPVDAHPAWPRRADRLRAATDSRARLSGLGGVRAVYAVGVAAFFVAERIAFRSSCRCASARARRSMVRWGPYAHRLIGARVPATAFVALAAYEPAAAAPRRPLGRRTAAGGTPRDSAATTRLNKWATTLESNAPRRGVADYGVGVQLRRGAGRTGGSAPAPGVRSRHTAKRLRARHRAAANRRFGRSRTRAAERLPGRCDRCLAANGPTRDAGKGADRGGTILSSCRRAPTGACKRARKYGLNLLVLDRCEPAIAELPKQRASTRPIRTLLLTWRTARLKLGALAEARTHAEAALALNPAHPLAQQVRSVTR